MQKVSGGLNDWTAIATLLPTKICCFVFDKVHTKPSTATAKHESMQGTLQENWRPSSITNNYTAIMRTTTEIATRVCFVLASRLPRSTIILLLSNYSCHSYVQRHRSCACFDIAENVDPASQLHHAAVALRTCSRNTRNPSRANTS